MGALAAAAAQERQTENRTLIFTYGTLKRGFSNHPLLHDMIRTGDAVFLGEYVSMEKFPLVCGPYSVPFLLNLPRSGHRICGELYAVSLPALARIDVLEGIATGHYERLPIAVSRPIDAEPEKEIVRAEAYYAHRSYAEEMWRRSGEKGMAAYTQDAAQGYVRRADRPPDKTFLEHIQTFLSSPS
ncbi:hypothetical protein ACLOJK_030523 [Asimina triloba]